jgi:two-component system phosphate regulon sensor histidine kinase PhoR
MRSSTLKWLSLSATVLIALIILVQLYWLKKVYSFEQNQFTVNVMKSIRGVFEDLEMNDNPALNLQQLINRPDQDYFLFKADTIPIKDSLVYYLQHEFEDFNILTNVKIGIYSAQSRNYIDQVSIEMPPSASGSQPAYGLPVFATDYDHILLYFPNRNKYILSEMNFWIISSVVLSLALIGLAISLFYFYRQKFLAEIQKDFVNNFTHEFKTPLAVIKIAGDVLDQENIVHQPDRLARYTAIIKHQTEHLQSQVERLLKASSIQHRQLPISKKRVNPQHLIEEALNKVQPLVDQKHARIELKLDNQKEEIEADPAHLELAIVNILENALKYSQDPKILVESGKEESDFYISVKDNGIGIEKKYLKNIFKKFYRVPTGDVHNVKGFGLGLNFVKRIVDAHDGRIRVHSLPGIGTEFKLFIPYN